MNLLKKPFPQKITIVFTVLLLSACGGGTSASREALSPTEELQTLADNTVAQALVVAPVPNPLNPADPTDIANTNDIASAGATAAALAAGAPAGTFINVGLPGIADVFIGTVDLPYYFDPANSTTSFWSTPVAVVDTLTVPLMMTIPNANSGQPMPAAGWPIVMYQHGITRNRTDVIAYADAQAQAGFAVIAIDLPTHGLTDVNNPFHAVNTPFEDTEQTFGANATSGQNFINIPSLLTSRDNVRQGAANLLTLRRSLGSIISLATGAPAPLAIDTSRVGLIGHSLGGIVAIPYLGVETTPTPSSILMSGATITTVLQESATFGPVIAAGLAPLGVVTPEDISDFYISAQQTIDSGEPANYIAAAAATHPIHFVEIVGDGGDNLPDQVVPNSATENLVAIAGANSISTTTPGIAPGSPGIVRFIAGDHGSPLDPTSSPAVTFEIQSQLAVFQATSGTVIQITNGNVIQ